MFTGIVQDIGTIVEIEHKEHAARLGVLTQLPLSDLSLGASIACNGCCLTVTQAQETPEGRVFYVDVGPETLTLSRFGTFQKGQKLNLEPALKVGDSLGGHQVTGHLDGTFPIKKIAPTKDGFWDLCLSFPKKYARFLILKGSLCVAGISLTIAQIDSSPNDSIYVSFMIIPHTYHNTILQYLSAEEWPPSSLEIEFDNLVKTVACVVESMIINYSQIPR
jgi:riboflavin synthase